MTGIKQTSGNNPGNGTTLSATATCPVGKLLVGGGGQVTTTQASGRVTLQQSYPSTTTVWTAVGIVTNNVTGNNTMSVQAFALCV